MSVLIKLEQVKELPKILGVTRAYFSERSGYSEQSFKDFQRKKVNKKVKMKVHKQEDIIDTAIQIAELKKMKSEKLDELIINSTAWKGVFDIINNWVKNADIEVLASYWENFENLYKTINLEETRFLYSCSEISEPASSVDKRPELLSYMKQEKGLLKLYCKHL